MPRIPEEGIDRIKRETDLYESAVGFGGIIIEAAPAYCAEIRGAAEVAANVDDGTFEDEGLVWAGDGGPVVGASMRMSLFCG